jgi:hypothetical protein
MKMLGTTTLAVAAALVLGIGAACATEFHVATTGKDSNAGANGAPFRTLQRAADAAQPGDTITVHEGVYRERVTPPRGGTSDARRIIYQAARGEKVVITGSEPVKGWVKVTNDTWTVTLPSDFFGSFNPYRDLIHGDWFDGRGRRHHTGAIYVNGHWLTEAARLVEVLKPAGTSPLWCTDDAGGSGYLLNLVSITIGSHRLAADAFAAKSGELHPGPSSEGGNCVGWIRDGSWLKFEKVDFGTDTQEIEVRVAAQDEGGEIEFRAGGPEGELLGTQHIATTGDWQNWKSCAARIRKTSGVQTLCLVFRTPRSDAANTTLWAQFPGMNPNELPVEINVRQTVFTPEKTGINYITVRGFDLRNAATPWAPPTAGQIGLVSAYWCKGWIIEDNEISYSVCSGVALGKYSDEWDNRAESAEGYVGTLTRALTNGWNKATVGGHTVRNNNIHDCEQTGIVGSLGCSFSTIAGNDIHDIHMRELFSGAEMAGIKFHGAVDVVISRNHIYRCGSVGGIWLDWMAQGAQVTGNFMHDNRVQDIFFEMQHGPILVANNLFLSPRHSFELNSQGVAFAHNLIRGAIGSYRNDTRATPFHKTHSTELAGMHADSAQNDSGDHRFYNNLFLAPCSLQAVDSSALPCFAAGDVFTKGTRPSKFDVNPLLKPDFDPALKLTQKTDGWYLELSQDKAWRAEARCKPVTTELLGKARVSECAYENPDGSRVDINTDYFGQKRDKTNPFPGPFESVGEGAQSIKVWPVSVRN